MLFNVLNIADVALYCGILGTIILGIKALAPLDLGTEVSGDFNVLTDSDASFNVLTIEGISAFFTCAGWMGWFCINYMHYSIKLSAAIAGVSGIVGMLFFVWLLAKLKKMDCVPTANLEELVGKVGKAYMNFAPKGSAKIQIEYNSEYATLDAINDSDEEIKSFENIKVVKVVNNQVYIVKEGN